MAKCLICKKDVKDGWAEKRGMPPVHKACLAKADLPQRALVDAARNIHRAATNAMAGKAHDASLTEGVGLGGKEG